MPASTMEIMATALKSSLSGAESQMDMKLKAASHKSYLVPVKFEKAGSFKVTVLEGLKSKYIVLKVSTGQPAPSQKSVDLEEESLQPPARELFPMENVQLGWGNSNKDWGVGAGMVNVGNTCYLNSTLQALFHVPSLCNWLMSEKDHIAICEDNGTCMICAMRRTLVESQQRNVNQMRPILVYLKLRTICRNLMPGRQEDAHEFLRYLVEAMEKSYLQRFKNYTQFEPKIKETTPLNQILGGYLRSAVRCLRCGHVSTTFQHFQDLMLDIRKVQTVEEAMESYFSREKLDDESYQCEKCQRNVPATKQFQLERAPMVLCIQLKRFSISNNKISKHIAFRQRLDLTKYARQRPAVPLAYKLVALVSHMGPTVTCGHYTAVARVPSGSFYQFDDSNVRPISHQTVFNTNAYIMLYELENAPRIIKTVPPVQPSKSSTITVGFTSNKMYGPELPPERLSVTTTSFNGKAKAASSTSISPSIPDEYSTDSSEEEPPTSSSVKEADSSTANDVEVKESPDGSPSSSTVSTSVSSLTSPEGTTKIGPSKSLVPYETGDTSEDSNHSDNERRVATKATNGDWQVTSSTDVTTLANKPSSTNNVVTELFKMSTTGYTAPVSTWNGTRSQLDKDVQNERREDRKRTLADSSDEQPRAKHAKVTSSFKSKSNPGYNPVQEYHNSKNGWSNSSNSSSYHHKPYYHGNRHKRNFHHGPKGNFHKNSNNYRFR